MNFIKNRLKSFSYAWAGIVAAWRTQINMRLHLIAMVVVIGLGFYFKIERWEWAAILICIGVVIALEMLNSAIEKLCDFVCEEKHEYIKYIKDVSAGAVFVAAIMAFCIGILIFWERGYGMF